MQKTREASCSVRGLVVRAIDGESIKGARVVLLGGDGPGQSYQMATGADGAFAFDAVVPGTYHLGVVKGGFVPQRHGQKKPRGEGAPIALIAGQRVHDLVFRMVATAALTGRVLDEEGEPVIGALVEAIPEHQGKGLLERYRPARPEGDRSAGKAITDDRGEYRIAGLTPARYLVRATDRNVVPGLSEYDRRTGWAWFSSSEWLEAGKSYPPTFYPGTQQMDQAAPVSLRPGEEVALDIRLLPQASRARVSGRVVAPKGLPGPAQIWLEPLTAGKYHFSSGRQALTKENGYFEIKQVSPGDYFVHARGRPDIGNYSARQKISLAESDVELLLVLSPARQIAGRVMTEGGAKLGRDGAGVSLVPVDQGPLGYGSVDTEIRKDGTFLLPEVPENTYTVYVGIEGDAYLKSARYGMEEVLIGGLEVSRETPEAALELVISGASSRLQGNVVDARRKPAVGAQVLLVPQQKGFVQRHFNHVRSDQNGNFEMRGIAPGKYKLIATIDDETELASMELTFGESESRSVELKADQQETASSNR